MAIPGALPHPARQQWWGSGRPRGHPAHTFRTAGLTCHDGWRHGCFVKGHSGSMPNGGWKILPAGARSALA
ncbi:hypothetical protein V5799_022691 [Amblyomma americanum]|uniref:Uncharacterized protein n=1 Tax=Amblyomma americanum TaxID=6943 RepID=A0AAQ4FJN5_AMBAM